MIIIDILKYAYGTSVIALLRWCQGLKFCPDRYQGAGKLPAAVIRALGPEGPEGEDHCPEGPKGPRVGQMCEPEGP